MNHKILNVVTLPDKKRFLSLNPKYFIKSLISLFKKYHGHAAVTESLIKGLKLNNYNFSYNNYDEFHEICWVLSGIDTLEYFLRNKNYNKLIVGPNVVNMPYDKKYLINHKFVDLIIVPSQWVETAYKQYTNKNIFKWYAGVDMDYWIPKNNINRDKILIYVKTRELDLIHEIQNFLNKKGYPYIEIYYGSYNKKDFKRKLNQAYLSIFISISESQGIALLESWSMNVPTLVWKSNAKILDNIVYDSTSSAPYLNSNLGLFFEDIEDFKKKIELMKKNKQSFNTRSWVLSNMSNKITSSIAIKKIQELL